MNKTKEAAVRESGISWVGEIPSHWDVRRVKWTVSDCANGIWGNEPDGVDDVVCVRVADFDRSALKVRLDAPTMRAVEPSQRESRQLRAGDLLIEKSGGGDKQLVGCVVQFDHNIEAVCSNFVARMPVKPGHCARYWCYVHASLYSGRLNYPAIKQTTGIQNLDAGAYLNTLVAYPPFQEQEQIASFLDWKTSQIDTLIEKKRALIETLKEKRLAVITQAVAKGVDDDAPLRESGIPWLGVVPEHWEITPLGFLVTMSGGLTPSMANPAYWGGETPWVTPKDMKLLRISDSVDHVSDEALADTSLTLYPVDTILIVVRGMILAHSFPVAIAEAPVTINQDMKALRCAPALDPEYLFWCLSGFAKVLSGLAQESAHGTRKIESETIKKFAMPVPPLPEQVTIVTRLRDRLQRIDNLQAAAERTISRQAEYRSALITAAVTGKLDMRKIAIPATA